MPTIELTFSLQDQIKQFKLQMHKNKKNKEEEKEKKEKKEKKVKQQNIQNLKKEQLHLKQLEIQRKQQLNEINHLQHNLDIMLVASPVGQQHQQQRSSSGGGGGGGGGRRRTNNDRKSKSAHIHRYGKTSKTLLFKDHHQQNLSASFSSASNGGSWHVAMQPVGERWLDMGMAPSIPKSNQ